MENPLKEFMEASNALDARLEQSTKEEVAECARILALNLAHYKLRFGEIPLEENELPQEDITPEMASLLASGMLEMITALEQVMNGGIDDTEALH